MAPTFIARNEATRQYHYCIEWITSSLRSRNDGDGRIITHPPEFFFIFTVVHSAFGWCISGPEVHDSRNHIFSQPDFSE